jgi:hypothetical protein
MSRMEQCIVQLRLATDSSVDIMFMEFIPEGIIKEGAVHKCIGR